ncbi:MAG: hypothetical protein KF726_23910 [Anaerolineae bacterium]|nr:hypothetical protein [Anaerolineae bacterium]
MSHSRWFIFLILMVCAAILSACDPLAPEPTAIVVVITPTTPSPTLIVQPTETFTPSPTLTPTRTPTLPPTSTFTPSPTLEPTATYTAIACAETEGQIVDLSFDSKISNENLPYRVYLPPCYSQSGKRYPVLLLFHGSDRDQTEWTDALEVNKRLERGMALGALPPMIIVMPYGGWIANSNTEFGISPTWEDVVITELMPEIQNTFCTWNAREGRAIGGISRGGFWSFEIGFRHPEMFSAIGGHSAFFDEDHIVRQYAPEYNPLWLADTISFPKGMQPRMYLDVGKDDYARSEIENFKDKLIARGIDPGFVLNPEGQHEIDYWKEHTAEYLSFYGRMWPRNAAELPSCLG